MRSAVRWLGCLSLSRTLSFLLSLFLIVAVQATALAQNTKFSAWTFSSQWTDSPFPLQFAHLDPRAERQHANGNVIAFAQMFPGHLYIIGGDEPDQHCVNPTTVATEYANMVGQIKAVDPTARFSPAGFAQNNPFPCGWGHGITYAQHFYNALQATPIPANRQVDEWRFHRFIDPADIPGWKAEVGSMAAWSVAHGGYMVLGSWGRPDYNTMDLRPIMRELMDWIDADWRIVSAVWWSYDIDPTTHKLTTGPGPEPRVLTPEGEVVREYATRSISPARSGSAILPSFDTDIDSDFADYDPISGAFFVHENTGGGFSTTGVGPTLAAAGADWDVLVADFTNDRRAEYIDVHVPSGSFWVHHNQGGFSFNPTHFLSGVTVAGPNRELLAVDFDGDGYADLIEHDLSTGQFWVKRYAGGSSFVYMNSGREVGRTKTGPDWRAVFGDFTGDGVGDFVDVHVPSANFWVHKGAKWDPYTSNPTNVVVSSVHWGQGTGAAGANWRLIFGDFTGDGRADYADLWVPTGAFWVHPNNGTGQSFSASATMTGTAEAGGSWHILGSR